MLWRIIKGYLSIGVVIGGISSTRFMVDNHVHSKQKDRGLILKLLTWLYLVASMTISWLPFFGIFTYKQIKQRK